MCNVIGSAGMVVTCVVQALVQKAQSPHDVRERNVLGPRCRLQAVRMQPGKAVIVFTYG